MFTPIPSGRRPPALRLIFSIIFPQPSQRHRQVLRILEKGHGSIPDKMKPARVLSIQSHVVRGYVGNKSATFPLQILGFEVDAINSVQLSNHTGYEHFRGQILDENDLEVLIDSLRRNDLLHYSHLLTGYIGSPSFLNKVASVVKELKSNNPNLLYVCDPVMGDDGHMYVPESLLPIYKETILPLADVITPNQYELELLSGQSITTEDEAWCAIDSFHSKGCRTVIVSSSTLGCNNELISLASTRKDGKATRVKMSIPKLDAHFVGSGDLFAALMMAWLHKTGDNIQQSLDNTIYSLQAVLKRTLSHALVLSKGERPTPEQMELQLIQSKADIECPKPVVRSVEIVN